MGILQSSPASALQKGRQRIRIGMIDSQQSVSWQLAVTFNFHPY